MSGRYEDILEAVGNTPLVRLNRLAADLQAQVYAKVEFTNPGGSVKDRVAIAMVERAEKEGLLRPGGTIIEATSGNTGVGLAMVAAVKGYRCIFIMPDKMSTEKIRLLKAYGAEVVMTPASAETNAPDGYGGVAQRLLNEIPNSWQPNQFSNLVNPQYHYQTTGPEIWRQTEGRISAFVAGIGTGGTISGVGKYLKERNPAIRVVGADPAGSILSGDVLHPWAVEGIGEDYVPQTLNSHVVDEWIRITDTDSFQTARRLSQEEGLLVGGSSGTAVAAALQYARRLGPNDVVVAICPDTGRNYLTKVYSDDWMVEQGYLTRDARRYALGDLIQSRGPVELVSVGPDQRAQDAVDLLRKYGISQMPVLERGQVVGAIREITLAKLLHEHTDPRQVAVRDIMARPLPQLDESVDLDEVYRLMMSGNSGVITTRGGEVTGIVARIDLVDFWDRVAIPLETTPTDQVPDPAEQQAT
ncbi:MAG: cystathionine beta-synthase [bacterium]|nr:cystathionine beta-synthase [bacterium]